MLETSEAVTPLFVKSSHLRLLTPLLIMTDVLRKQISEEKCVSFRVFCLLSDTSETRPDCIGYYH